MIRLIHLCCLCSIALAGLIGLAQIAYGAEDPRDPYIVVFKDSIDAPGQLARSQAQQYGGRLGFVYRYAIEGYSAELPAAAVDALRRDPRVDYVSPDGYATTLEDVELETEDNEGVEPLEVTIPTGISRTFAAGNKALDIDGQDDIRANVDVAVLDTGIDQSQSDLNVVGRTNCMIEAEKCVANNGTDGNSHGTHVAGTIAAIDNGFGVVGMAPGARLWAVKVLSDAGSGSFSQITAGIDWVTAHSSEIEVANMSLGGFGSSIPLREALNASVSKGVVYVVAAGNSNINASNVTPANIEAAVTVSAISDYDGKPGGEGSSTCTNAGPDDEKAEFSNWGTIIDITAPGVCILSTKPGNTYGLKTGTSMASPHVAGAAAILAAQSNPNSKADVEAIVKTLRNTGNYGWTDTSGDGVKEPLLDVHSESTYSLVSAPKVSTDPVTYIGTGASTETVLTGTVNPKGLSTTYQFEYVEAAKYNPEAVNPYAEGSKAPLSPASLEGTVDKDYEVKAAVSGLKASTVYHYRIVAENSKGVSKSGDQTFTSLPSCKGAEGQCQWSIQSSANPQPQTENEFEDVSCASASMCMAVANDHYRSKGFAELWNGAEWKIIETFSGEAKSISCPTSTWCVVVPKAGSSGWRLESWGAWVNTSISLPTPEGGTGVTLKDVSCTSETACTAVGRYSVSGVYKPYVARWNGSTWALQSAPSPSEGTASEAMLSVSCSSSSSCMAVGAAAEKPFAELWNGSEWTIRSTPAPKGATVSALEAVSCSSSTSCMAVGSYKSEGSFKTLTERWTGSEWTLVTSPNPAKEGDAKLRGVSCPSASACIAVGSLASPSFSPSEETTLVESWNGTAWTIQTSANPPGNSFSSLTAVSCASSSACTAVGSSRPSWGSANMVTLAERWNGEKWSIQSSANPQPQTENEFEDVSCASASMCMAVANDHYRSKGFAELWNGAEWKIIETFSGEAKSISCPTSTWCMTVTKASNGGWRLKWIEGWGFWSTEAISPPTPEGGTGVTLKDVSCTSETACTAVGRYSVSGVYKPYVARWNGSTWALQSAPSPSEGTASEAMLSVSCSSSSSCMAVGKAASKPFAEQWNGSEWTVKTAPNPEGATDAILESVSCAPAGTCMAVGNYYKGSGKRRTLTERWNGSSWLVVASPNPAKEGDAKLRSVSCLSGSSCIAVGLLDYPSSSGTQEEMTLAESWNGSEWSLQASPNKAGNLFSSLVGISCSSPVACTAVGSTRPKAELANMVTLAESWE